MAEHPDAGSPRDVLFDQGVLIAVTSDSVALYADLPAQVVVSSVRSRYVVAGDGTVGVVQGQPRCNETVEAVAFDMESGRVRWSASDLAQGRKQRTVYYRGPVAFEVLAQQRGAGERPAHPSAADGKVQLDYPFLLGMNHRRQRVRCLPTIGSAASTAGKDADKQRLPIQVSAIDAEAARSCHHPAGLDIASRR